MSFAIKNVSFVKTVIKSLDTKIFNNGILVRSNMIKIDSPIPEPENYPKYEVSKNEEEWKYVENLFPNEQVPEPPKNVSKTPSGWVPQTADVKKLSYFVERTRNHMLPLYLHIGHRGLHRRTVLKNIHGDIWLMERELKGYLQYMAQKPVGSRIHEISGTIMILGDHYSNVEQWLLLKGL